MSNSLWPHELHHKSILCPSPSPRVYSDSYPLWRRWWHPTSVLFPGKSHGWRSLVGYSPWGRQESDTTERLHFHFSLSCIGERNGNPLQCSYLENPRDKGAWWAAVYGVVQSQILLKWLSSSSSRYIIMRRKWFDSTKLVVSSIWCLLLWHKRLNKYICLSTNIYVHM